MASAFAGLMPVSRIAFSRSVPSVGTDRSGVEPYSIRRLGTYFIPKCISCSMSSG